MARVAREIERLQVRGGEDLREEFCRWVQMMEGNVLGQGLVRNPATKHCCYIDEGVILLHMVNSMILVVAFFD